MRLETADSRGLDSRVGRRNRIPAFKWIVCMSIQCVLIAARVLNMSGYSCL